jgi:hypothetical protein
MGARKQAATAPTSPQDWLSRTRGTRAYLLGLPRPRQSRLFAAAYWQAQVPWLAQHGYDSERLAEAAREAEKMADGLDYRAGLAAAGHSYTCLGPSAGEAAAAVVSAVLRHVPRKQSAALAHALFEDIFGGPVSPAQVNPSWLRWGGGTVLRLARRAYEEKDCAALPILADSLEEAGCDRPELLAHLRSPGPHVRGCWALDLLLGKS